MKNTSGDINDYKELISYNNNCDSGFSNMIANRLCYAVFYDLSMYSLNLTNEMMFPQLIKFYKFVFNFSIYLHCFPFHIDPDIMQQEYYVREYFDHKDNIFPNTAELKEFNYLDYSVGDESTDGTLLHGATDAGFRQMCDALIKDGFDCQKLNRNIGYRKTPYSLAEDEKDLFILTLFDHQVLVVFSVQYKKQVI